MEFNIKKASLLIISLIFLIGALQNTQYITLENFLSTQTYIKLAIFFAFLSLSVGVFSIINIDADYLNFFYLLPIFFFLLSAPLYLDMPFWSLKFLFFLFLIFPYATTYTKFLRTDQ
ncbi:MAG TPA: hypothetical protein ENJ78_00785, partial [candidate division WWE3 bacterium]|nr:hypothetical protein [candidate division WWE3 bacterium]